MANLFGSEWENFADQVVPRAASVLQREDMKAAFYAGAFAYMKAMQETVEAFDDDSAAMAAIESLQGEVNDWLDDYIARIAVKGVDA